MNSWVLGIWSFIFGSIACSSFYTVKLLIEIKYQILKDK